MNIEQINIEDTKLKEFAQKVLDQWEKEEKQEAENERSGRT